MVGTCQKTAQKIGAGGRVCVIRYWMIWVWVNTYRYIFSGMNIHKSQLFWGSRHGTRVLTHPHIGI